MRWSFDSLARLVQQIFMEDPLSGHLFVFRNRRGDRLKILYWDRDGYAIWYKRLEQGVFRFPKHNGEGLEVSAGDLALVLEGINITGVKRQKRFRRRGVPRNEQA
jgi:transposase